MCVVCSDNRIHPVHKSWYMRIKCKLSLYCAAFSRAHNADLDPSFLHSLDPVSTDYRVKYVPHQRSAGVTKTGIKWFPVVPGAKHVDGELRFVFAYLTEAVDTGLTRTYGNLEKEYESDD